MLNEKVKQIIIQSGYSPSHFADAIGVQRSSISHILANRNKPSFDILQKIIKKFPELGYEWLEEDGDASAFQMMADQTLLAAKRGPKPTLQEQRIPSTINGNILKNTPQSTLLSESNRKNTPESFPIQPSLMAQALAGNDEKTVERIIVFFSDHSFKEYKAQ
jgi:transcriptional regulator with XRE-family HTH domain